MRRRSRLTDHRPGSDQGLDRASPLGLRPVRKAEWDEPSADSGTDPSQGPDGGEPDGRVVIERPIPGGWSPRAILERLSAMTGVRRLRLDERGSFLWCRIDGERTIGALADELRGEFGETVEPAEERVTRFLSWLERERLVDHLDPAGLPAKLGRR